MAGVVLAGVFAAHWFRHFGIDVVRVTLERRLERITGREVTIESDFDLAPSLTPTLAAQGLRIANAEWASNEPMLAAERVEVQIQLIPLLFRGDVLIERLTISEADLLLEAGAGERSNWRFEAPEPPAAAQGKRRGLLLDNVTIEDSRLRWRGVGKPEADVLRLDRLAWRAPDLTSRVTLTGAGRLRGRSFEVSGEVGPLAELFGAPASYPVSVEAALDQMTVTLEGELGLRKDPTRLQIAISGRRLARLLGAFGIEMAHFGPYQATGTLTGDFERLTLENVQARAGGEETSLSFSGTIGNLLELDGLDLAAVVNGRDLAGLSPLAGAALPPSRPYRITGQIEGSIDHMRLEGLAAEIADSRLTGRLAIQRRDGEPVRLEGVLSADRLDADRLLALAQKRPAAAEVEAGGTRKKSLSLEWLEAAEAEIDLSAKDVRFDQMDFEGASVRLTLRGGRLGVRDLILQAGGGEVTGRGALEALDSGDLAEVTVRLQADDIDVGRLLADWAVTEKIRAEIDIDINVSSTAGSLEGFLAGLEGHAGVVGEGGELQDTRLDRLVTDLDILRALPPFWRRGDDTVRVNCLVTDLEIEEGVAQTDAMLDTKRMTLLGQGTVDLTEGQLDLALQPKAKTRKLSTLAVPVDITGSLASPEVHPRQGSAAGQAIRGVLGGLLVPLNQLSALFGTETMDACRQALQQASERSDSAARSHSQMPAR